MAVRIPFERAMSRKGRRTRSTRNMRVAGDELIKLSSPEVTTKKSSWFQGSWR